jgi:hypothetical protein
MSGSLGLSATLRGALFEPSRLDLCRASENADDKGGKIPASERTAIAHQFSNLLLGKPRSARPGMNLSVVGDDNIELEAVRRDQLRITFAARASGNDVAAPLGALESES